MIDKYHLPISGCKSTGKAFQRMFPDTDNIDLPTVAFERALPFLRDFEDDPRRVRRDSTLFGDALLTADCLEYDKLRDALVKSFKLAHEYDKDAGLTERNGEMV